MKDYSAYFLPTFEYSLEQVNYKRLDTVDSSDEKQLNCTDKLRNMLIDEKHVSFEFTRELHFSSNDLFALSVTFSAVYTLNENDHGDIDWNSSEVAKDILHSNSTFLNMLITRASLLISQLTSSFGQAPIITPPTSIREAE